VPLGTVLPAMLGVHAVIAAGEAVITVAAVSAVLATRPDLIHGPVPEPASSVLPDPAIS
jgi:cobalt/nickel transport system permease protein